MNPGDIVTIFGSPIELKHSVGQARLVNCIQKFTTCEIWEVEFTDQEGILFRKVIRKLNYKKSNLILDLNYERRKKETDQYNGSSY